MILSDGIGYTLEQHGLTRLRLGHDKTSLSLSDRGEEVDYPAGDILLVTVTEEIELLIREKRCEEIERNPVPDELRRAAIDILDAHEREVLVTFLRRTDFSGYGVARLQRIALYLILGYIDIIRGIEIIVVRRTEETVAVRHDFKHSRRLDGALELNFRLTLLPGLVLPVLPGLSHRVPSVERIPVAGILLWSILLCIFSRILLLLLEMLSYPLDKHLILLLLRGQFLRIQIAVLLFLLYVKLRLGILNRLLCRCFRNRFFRF